MVELAQSQGFYGRLLQVFNATDAKVHSILDFVTYIDG